MELSECDRGWVAGYLEGEASFQVQDGYRRKSGYQNTRARISVSSTDKDVILRLQELLGGTVRQGNMHTKPKLHGGMCKPNWWWQQGDQRKIHTLLNLIRPLMSIRCQFKIDQLLKTDAMERVMSV